MITKRSTGTSTTSPLPHSPPNPEPSCLLPFPIRKLTNGGKDLEADYGLPDTPGPGADGLADTCERHGVAFAFGAIYCVSVRRPVFVGHHDAATGLMQARELNDFRELSAST